MFHHIRKLSSTAPVKAVAASSPIEMMFHHIRKISSSTVKAAASPISSSVLYPKNNKVVVEVRGVMEEDDQKSFQSKKPAAAEGPPPPLEISLRPFQVTDVDDMMVWGTDEELSRYCRWKIYKPKKGEGYLGWKIFKPFEGYYAWEICEEERYSLPGQLYLYWGWDLEIYRSKEDALEDIKNNIIPHPWFRAICLKNRPIGKIFIDPCRPNNPYKGELGYVVASEHQGKGIATTAVKMALDSVFKEWPLLTRLQAQVHVENLGAQRVLEKAGFVKEGVLPRGWSYPDKEGRRPDIHSFRLLSY